LPNCLEHIDHRDVLATELAGQDGAALEE
jgi:hypothetical protein